MAGYASKGVLCSLQKAGDPAVCTAMALEDIVLRGESQSREDRCCLTARHEATDRVKLTERDSGAVAAGEASCSSMRIKYELVNC